MEKSDKVYVLTTVWKHAMDSGEDVKVVGVFKTFEEASVTGQEYRKANRIVSPIDGIARDNYQYQYCVRELTVSDSAGENFWKQKQQEEKDIREREEAAEREYQGRLKAWEAMKPKR